jgi:hypothetical protein
MDAKLTAQQIIREDYPVMIAADRQHRTRAIQNGDAQAVARYTRSINELTEDLKAAQQ